MKGHNHIAFSLAAAAVVNTLIFDVTHLSMAGTPANLALTEQLLPLASQSLTFTDLLYKSAFYGGILLGSIAPDIDTPKSLISHLFPWVSRIVTSFCKHRTLAHSLPGIVAAFIFWGILLALGIGLFNAIVFSLSAEMMHAAFLFYLATALGCFLHSFEDTMTFAGIPWLYPLSRRSQHFPFIRFRSGSLTEYAVVLFFIVLVGLGLLYHLFLF